MKLRGKWLRQYIVLIGFFFFDYLSTITHCTNPAQEWNPIARSLMIAVGDIFLGMTIFLISWSISWYGAMLLFSYVTEDAKNQGDKLRYIILNFFDSVFLPTFAGVDFGLGATSWYWHIPNIIKMVIGAFLYLILDIAWIRKGS